MFKIAQLTDVHLPPLPMPKVFELFSKRAFGFVNWHMKRKDAHLQPVIDAHLEALQTLAPDHISVTGDLTNLALDDEIKNARSFLERLGKPADVTAILGNHDDYVEGSKAKVLEAWAPYLASDGETQPVFPSLRRRGAISLIGLNSAVPRPFGWSAGRLGHEQLQKLRSILLQEKTRGAFRLVMLHHPPLARLAKAPKKGLEDSQALCTVLEEAGAELVLFGHIHTLGFTPFETTDGPAMIVSAPSASMAGDRDNAAGGGFLMHSIERQIDGWTVNHQLIGAIEENGVLKGVALRSEQSHFART